LGKEATVIARRAFLITVAAVLGLPASFVAQQPPQGATARCRDGIYSFSRTRSGTCSHHGGVAQWLTPSQPPAAAVAPQPQQATQGQTLTAAEAKAHIGETATVCGTVASARYAAQSRGRPTFLNLDAPYPNQVFTVVIWGDARLNFPEPPEAAYRRKRICVTGLIETYRGVPQIVVRTPATIRAPSQ
jgi:DNA/RNA endonuclease YhcR with UshA esterase domain